MNRINHGDNVNVSTVTHANACTYCTRTYLKSSGMQKIHPPIDAHMHIWELDGDTTERDRQI